MAVSDEAPRGARELFAAGPVRGTVVLVLVLAAAVLLREVAPLLVPLLFGAFLALIAWPLVGALARRNVDHRIALALTILVVLVVVVGAAAIIALSVGELVVHIPRYEDRLTDEIASLRALLAQFGINADPQALLAVISPEQLASFVRPLASAVSSAGLAILVLTLTMAYALVGASSLQTRAAAAFGAGHPLLDGFARFGSDLRRYLLVRAALGLFAAVLAFVLLLIVGVPLPALWAFLVFAASFIPNVGVILALIPPTILAFLDSGIGAALAVVVGYVVINFAQDNFLQPIILGSELNLTPLVVFVAVIVWAWILGAAGALLAVPLTVALVAVLEAFPSTRPVAALMRNRIDAPAGLVEKPPAPRARRDRGSGRKARVAED
jgi:AI-2 transport protein TqsA